MARLIYQSHPSLSSGKLVALAYKIAQQMESGLRQFIPLFSAAVDGEAAQTVLFRRGAGIDVILPRRWMYSRYPRRNKMTGSEKIVEVAGDEPKVLLEGLEPKTPGAYDFGQWGSGSWGGGSPHHWVTSNYNGVLEDAAVGAYASLPRGLYAFELFNVALLRRKQEYIPQPVTLFDATGTLMLTADWGPTATAPTVNEKANFVGWRATRTVDAAGKSTYSLGSAGAVSSAVPSTPRVELNFNFTVGFGPTGAIQQDFPYAALPHCTYVGGLTRSPRYALDEALIVGGTNARPAQLDGTSGAAFAQAGRTGVSQWGSYGFLETKAITAYPTVWNAHLSHGYVSKPLFVASFVYNSGAPVYELIYNTPKRFGKATFASTIAAVSTALSRRPNAYNPAEDNNHRNPFGAGSYAFVPHTLEHAGMVHMLVVGDAVREDVAISTLGKNTLRHTLNTVLEYATLDLTTKKTVVEKLRSGSASGTATVSSTQPHPTLQWPGRTDAFRCETYDVVAAPDLSGDTPGMFLVAVAEFIVLGFDGSKALTMDDMWSQHDLNVSPTACTLYALKPGGTLIPLVRLGMTGLHQHVFPGTGGGAAQSLLVFSSTLTGEATLCQLYAKLLGWDKEKDGTYKLSAPHNKVLALPLPRASCCGGSLFLDLGLDTEYAKVAFDDPQPDAKPPAVNKLDKGAVVPIAEITEAKPLLPFPVGVSGRRYDGTRQKDIASTETELLRMPPAA